jgi:hypothetical protein
LSLTATIPQTQHPLTAMQYSSVNDLLHAMQQNSTNSTLLAENNKIQKDDTTPTTTEASDLRKSDIENIQKSIRQKRSRLKSFSGTPDDETETWSKIDQFNKFKTRADRYLSSRPAIYNAIVTALGDDLAATMAGLLRNVSEGVLNFANASEEAFKGLLKFVLNVSSIGVTESIIKTAAKFTLPKHMHDEARNIMRLPFESLASKELLAKELENILLTGPRDHLNNFELMEGFSKEQKIVELFKANEALKFAQTFKPSEDEIGKIKNFQLGVRFFESGIKGSLWASIPFLNRLFRTHVLGAEGFTGLKGVQETEKHTMNPLQKLAVGMSLGFGFIFQGGVIALNKMNENGNKFAKWVINNTGFSQGLFPTKSAIYFNQGLAYDASRLANSQGKAEIFESGLITSLFTPILYFGDIFTRFIGNMADKNLAKKYGIEEGILVKKDPNAKGLLANFTKHFPHEIHHGEMIPKTDHDPDLKRDAKLAHADMTISKILLHSLTVFATRIFINKETKSFAKSHA